MNIPSDLKYTKNDEWIKVEGNQGTVGITDYAQEQLSDIVFVEIIPAEGDDIAKGLGGVINSVGARIGLHQTVVTQVFIDKQGIQRGGVKASQEHADHNQ